MSAWLGETLVATTLLMAAVLLLRAPVRRLFGSGVAYALWLIPAVRLVLPPLHLPSTAPGVANEAAGIVFATAASSPIAWNALFALWATGALLFAVWQVASYRRFTARVSRAAITEASMIGGRRVQLLRSDAVHGPAAIGLITRRILLPPDFDDRFTPEEQAMALAHEHVHHARGDLWANAAALGMLALHWFNPLAHWAYRAFREDQELSCDAAVIAASGPDARAAYGSAMVKAVHNAFSRGRPVPNGACPMTRICNLKRRLKMVGMHRKSAAASAGGAMLVGLLTLSGLTLTATSGIAAEPIKSIKTIRVKRVDGVADVAGALGKELGERCAESGRYESRVKSQVDGKPAETLFILCNKADAPPADRLASLEKVRAGLLTDTDVPAEQRGKIIASLDRAIANLKAGN